MINEVETPLGKRFAIAVQILIILSIVSFSIETLPNLPITTKNGLKSFEFFCIIFFTIEYLLRLIFSEKRLNYAFSFYGLVDLVAILPFYITMGLDLRTLRMLRMLRLFRILKLMRYNKAIDHFKRAIVEAKEEIILFLLITGILIYLSAVGIYFFENEAQPDKFSSIFDSLWWAVSTLTTVGYGDVYPITLGGKIFTFCVLIIGLGFVTIPAGIIASALSGSTKKNTDDKD